MRKWCIVGRAAPRRGLGVWEEGQRPRRHWVGGERHQGEGWVCVLRCAAAMAAATMEDGAAGRWVMRGGTAGWGASGAHKACGRAWCRTRLREVGHLVGRLEGEDLPTALTVTLKSRSCRVAGPLLCPYILQHHSRCEFTGEKTPRTQPTRTNAAEMNRDELAFVSWTYGPVRSC